MPDFDYCYLLHTCPHTPIHILVLLYSSLQLMHAPHRHVPSYFYKCVLSLRVLVFTGVFVVVGGGGGEGVLVRSAYSEAERGPM